MDPNISILMYSKYSQQCIKLIELINKDNFLEATKLKLVCIDNEKIRKRILKSKKIKVNSVPCMLLFFSNGNVEKHDGVNLFNWVYSTIEKINPSIQKQPIIQQNQIRKSVDTKKQKINETITQIDELLSGEEEEEEEEEKILVKKHKSPELNRKPPRGIKSSSDTSKKDISTLAAELAKQRENDFDDNKRPPGIPPNNKF
jgi:hypothetical protein